MKVQSFVILSVVFGTVYSVCWTTHHLPYQKGLISSTGCLDSGKCTTLFPISRTIFTSINVTDGCIRLYENIGCLGHYLEFNSTETNQDNLLKIGWKRTRSIGECSISSSLTNFICKY
ncbi:hypothetical protein O3M35_011425 [Rhynocoris fuscipes]|uniref:Uncharacterized protein n=1 Tax=Rhynocoris fuscipes TaxID=488301 RepID=A0AAW1CW76_9HEMI